MDTYIYCSTKLISFILTVKFLILFTDGFTSVLLIPITDSSADVHTEQTFIKDEANRIRLYHGINFVKKGFSWYPEHLVDPILEANMSPWSLNFIRLSEDFACEFPYNKVHAVSCNLFIILSDSLYCYSSSR